MPKPFGGNRRRKPGFKSPLRRDGEVFRKKDEGNSSTRERRQSAGIQHRVSELERYLERIPRMSEQEIMAIQKRLGVNPVQKERQGITSWKLSAEEYRRYLVNDLREQIKLLKEYLPDEKD